MKALLRHKPSPAMVVALIALFVALGGSAYAGVTLSRDSVRTVHIKNNAVTAPKIKRNAVRASDIRANAVRASEIRDGSVGTSEIADGAITSSKLANPEYYAVVNGSNGALVRGSAGVTSGLSGGTGYRVNFVVDVSHCVWIATIGRHTPTAPGIFSIVPSDAGVYLSPIDGGGSPQSVFVATYLGGAPASSDFHLLIRC